LFDKVKMKLIMQLLQELAPDLEIAILENFKLKHPEHGGKVWKIAILVREKKDESVLCGSTETSSEGKER